MPVWDRHYLLGEEIQEVQYPLIGEYSLPLKWIEYGVYEDLTTICPKPHSRYLRGTMVWAWMLWSAYALGTRTELWFGQGCSGQRMLLEHERNYDLGMDALVSVCSWNKNGIIVWAWMLWSAYALGTRTELCFGHGCSGQRMLLEHERNYVLGMDALVSVCSWNTNGIMVWAWMLWSADALGTRTGEPGHLAHPEPNS